MNKFVSFLFLVTVLGIARWLELKQLTLRAKLPGKTCHSAMLR